MVSLFGYDLWALVLGLAAGLACGFLNTAASSGSAVSLPILLMVGLDPVTANATNRIPVLIGALAATWSFHQKKAMLWGLAVKVSLPVAIGGLIGARMAQLLPARDLGLVITAAVLVALLLLFTKLKQAIESATSDTVRYDWRAALIFVGIGLWLGFIVLDGATYLLLALTLVVGLPLVSANAIKSAVLVPVTLVAMGVFAWRGDIAWTLGIVMGIGSIVGGLLGAHLAASPASRVWVFRLLVMVICAELVHLIVHYTLQTH
jgi:uncharacterized protein